MSEHYFSQKPQSKSSPMTWSSQLRGSTFTFESDHGVFSKHEVDYGSRLLIEHFEEPPAAGEILDLGCGYGPIGLAVAASYKNRSVMLTDINERAVTLARKNAGYNDITNAACALSNRYNHLKGRKFAAILTNPPVRAGKRTVHQMLEESEMALLKNGQLWMVLQKKQGAPSAIKKLDDLFGNVKVVERSKGYYILMSNK